MPTFLITPASLSRLRERLEAEGLHPAAVLTESGAVTGAALVRHWSEWIKARTSLADPGRLDRRWFATLLEEFFKGLGWGTLGVAQMDDGLMLLESSDWAEASPETAAVAACHFTAGALAEFFTGLAGRPIAVLEVECRSAGDPGCIFMVGSVEVIAAAEDLTDAGGTWREVLTAVQAG